MHLNLLAGTTPSGQPVFEPVHVLPLPDARYRIMATPALVAGCAAGDLVEVDEHGRSQVIEHGGNLAILAFVEHEAFGTDQVDALRRAFASVGGVVEAPAD
ncbi:DUF4265 domain-containing protein [Nonomuraea sp. NPDC026600]|uniref:DUF4265 domain-containing protein n=1 Tax=Nonomuraea sp. NPDC026600 TaxID=3155363 RepID=UPI0033E8C0B3